MQHKVNNAHAVRWYVLTFPTCHKGAVKGLRESELEVFAPEYVEAVRRNGAWTVTSRPLLLNYVFVHGSESQIYHQMQLGLGLLSFLPRVRASKDGGEDHYPYISDEAMKNLQWVARSYSNVLPVCTPLPETLMKGNKVRIIDGQFKGVEASIAVQPGPGQKDIVVCVESWMCVPLLKVQEGQYELVSLQGGDSHIYTRLCSDKLLDELHKALGHYHSDSLTVEDKKLAERVIREFGRLRLETDIQRSRQYALLLPAYTIAGQREQVGTTSAFIRELLATSTAPQTLALLAVSLYGCTDDSRIYDLAHSFVDPWLSESSPKKFKRQLIGHLDDYDRWLGHKE